MFDAKPIETSNLHVNNNSFKGPLIIGAFEKPAPLAMEIKAKLAMNIKLGSSYLGCSRVARPSWRCVCTSLAGEYGHNVLQRVG